MKKKVVLSCEHASNWVPKVARKEHLPKKNTHEAYDIGAKKITEYLAKTINTKPHLGEISRRLIDLNRTSKNPKRWGQLASLYTEEALKDIQQKFYLNYHENLQNEIRKTKLNVLHLSIHSFTGVLNGKTRNADLGILFNPKRKAEKIFAVELKKWIHSQLPTVKIRFNYPYLGIADGTTTNLRKIFTEKKYAGIEIEFNQNTAIQNQKLIKCFGEFLKEL